jgi:hypothetical protein
MVALLNFTAVPQRAISVPKQTPPAIANKMPEFLILAIPWAVTGTITSIIEGSGHKDMLLYPKNNSLQDFKNFARFPMGIPPDMKRNELTLLTH